MLINNKQLIKKRILLMNKLLNNFNFPIKINLLYKIISFKPITFT